MANERWECPYFMQMSIVMQTNGSEDTEAHTAYPVCQMMINKRKVFYLISFEIGVLHGMFAISSMLKNFLLSRKFKTLLFCLFWLNQ